MRVSGSDPALADLKATFAVSNNLIPAGQGEVTLFDEVVEGLVVDDDSDVSFTVLNQLFVDDLDGFGFREGFATAFSGAVGTLGQTVETQLIVEITGIPSGVTVTFPDTITSGASGATFTTESGDDEAVTSSSEAQRVVYEYSDDLPASGDEVDNFNVTPEVEFGADIGNGTAIIQLTLGPEGAAIPDTDFPSTDIPRFTEELLPAVELPEPTPTTLQFPVSRVSTEVVFALTNTATGGAVVTLRARDEDGNLSDGDDVAATAEATLAGRETLVWSLEELFGEGAGPDIVASIETESVNDDLIGTTISTSGGDRFATALIDDRKRLYLPFHRARATDDPEVTLHNGNDAATEVTLTLRDSSGGEVREVVSSVDTLAALRESLTEIFGLEAGALPLDGYLYLVADGEIRASLVNNPEGLADEVPGLHTFSQTRHIHPYFVFGAGWNTILTLINTSSLLKNVTLTLRDTDGEVMTGTAGVLEQIGSRSLKDFDLEELFGGANLAVGYLDLAIEGSGNPFASNPRFAGIVRIQTADFSSVAPLPVAATTDFFLAPTAQSDDEWTGLAIFNQAVEETVVTIAVFAGDGTSLGSEDITVAARAVQISLVRELVTDSADNEETYVRVTSDGGTIKVLAYRGSSALDEMLFIQGQVAP